MMFMCFSIKSRYSDIFIEKIIISFITACFVASHLLLCWHGFRYVSVTLYNVSVFLDVHPRSDSTEFHEIGRGSSNLLDLCRLFVHVGTIIL